MWPVCESTVHLQMCLEIKNRAEVMEPGGFGVEGAFPEYVSGLACWPIGKPYENYGGGQRHAELPIST